MHMSIRTYRMSQGSMDEVMHRIDVGLADAFAREPGFVSYTVTQTGEKTVASVTVFHEAEQADASNDLAAEWVASELADFGIERLGVMGGEVMVSRAAEDALVAAHR